MAEKKKGQVPQAPGQGLPEEDRIQDRRPELQYPKQAKSTKHIPREQPMRDPPLHQSQDDFQSQPRGGTQEEDNP